MSTVCLKIRIETIFPLPIPTFFFGGIFAKYSGVAHSVFAVEEDTEECISYSDTIIVLGHLSFSGDQFIWNDAPRCRDACI